MQQGSRLLSNVEVSAQIAEAQAGHLKRLEIEAGSILQELAMICFANMLDYIEITLGGSARVDLSRLTRAQAAAIVEITVEEFTERAADGTPMHGKRTRFKLADKRAALVDLGRHLKLFTDKIQVEGETQLEVSSVKRKLLAKLAGNSLA